LISDTVGFIRKLPHHLIEAFKATLEELKYANLLIHVIDASNPEWEQQVRVVDDMITALGAGDTPRIEAYNKCDLHTADVRRRSDNIVEISAKTGLGIEALLKKINESLSSANRNVTLRFSYSNAGLLDLIHREGVAHDVRYLTDVIEVDAVVGDGLYKTVGLFEVS